MRNSNWQAWMTLGIVAIAVWIAMLTVAMLYMGSM